jgi:ankyrin repeat protein
MLVSKGADVSLRDKDGWTALMWASWSGMDKFAKELIARGADVNAADRQGNTALMLASFEAHQPVVQLLVEKGANTKLVDNKGRTALDFAKEGLRQYPYRDNLYNQQILVLQNDHGSAADDLDEMDEH